MNESMTVERKACPSCRDAGIFQQLHPHKEGTYCPCCANVNPGTPHCHHWDAVPASWQQSTAEAKPAARKSTYNAFRFKRRFIQGPTDPDGTRNFSVYSYTRSTGDRWHQQVKPSGIILCNCPAFRGKGKGITCKHERDLALMLSRRDELAVCLSCGALDGEILAYDESGNVPIGRLCKACIHSQAEDQDALDYAEMREDEADQALCPECLGRITADYSSILEGEIEGYSCSGCGRPAVGVLSPVPLYPDPQRQNCDTVSVWRTPAVGSEHYTACHLMRTRQFDLVNGRAA